MRDTWAFPVAVLAGPEELAELRVPAPDAFDIVAESERSTALREGLRRLPMPERQVLALRYGLVGEPLEWQQVSALMGCSERTARRAASRGLARLKEAMAPVLLVEPR